MEVVGKILIVDDDRLFLDALNIIFEDKYNAVLAESGEQALRSVMIHRDIDAILLDIRMPHMDGLETARRLKELAPDIPIIFHTGFPGSYSQTSNEVRDLAFDFISKAESSHRLIRSVRNAVRYHRLKVAQEPDSEYAALCTVEDRIRVVAYSRTGDYRYIDEAALIRGGVYVYSLETIAFKLAIEEFETLVNCARTTEQELQAFFQRNPGFILHEEYRKAHSKIVLRRDDGGALIPDFVLEPFDNDRLCDLLELKKPSTPVVAGSKNRRRYSAAVLEGIAQLKMYRDYFDEEKHRLNIEMEYGLRAYRPRMFLILGRTPALDPVSRRRIEMSVADIELKTYDDILNRMKRKLRR